MRRPGERKWRIPGGKAAARLREFRMERGLTDIPAGGAMSAYFAAMQQKNQQMAALDPKAPQPRWSPMGPFSIPHGQTYGAAQLAVSGRVSCIAVDPKEPAHILVGSGSGGLWQSVDDGLSWLPVSAANGEFPMSVGAVAFVPGQSQVIYAGTGEGNAMSDYGVGVWKSTDSGATWSALAGSPFIGLVLQAGDRSAGCRAHVCRDYWRSFSEHRQRRHVGVRQDGSGGSTRDPMLGHIFASRRAGRREFHQRVVRRCSRWLVSIAGRRKQLECCTAGHGAKSVSPSCGVP